MNNRQQIFNQLTNDGTTLDKPTPTPQIHIAHTTPYWLDGFLNTTVEPFEIQGT